MGQDQKQNLKRYLIEGNGKNKTVRQLSEEFGVPKSTVQRIKTEISSEGD